MYIQICMYVHTFILLFVCTYIYKYVYVDVYMYVYVYVYVYIYICWAEGSYYIYIALVEPVLEETSA